MEKITKKQIEKMWLEIQSLDDRTTARILCYIFGAFKTLKGYEQNGRFFEMLKNAIKYSTEK